MTDLARLRQAAKIVRDDSGNEYVLIPADVYRQVMDESEPKSQLERINAALESWETEPGDAEWWDEFRQFLKDNPITHRILSRRA